MTIAIANPIRFHLDRRDLVGASYINAIHIDLAVCLGMFCRPNH